MTDEERRSDLYREVYEDLIGPLDPNSENLINGDPPNKRFCAGVLYPRGTQRVEIDDEDKPLGGRRGTEEQEQDEPISLSNARQQAAISLTFSVPGGRQIAVGVETASYRKAQEGQGTGKAYRRTPIVWHSDDEFNPPNAKTPIIERPVPGERLKVVLVYRYSVAGNAVVTAALENTCVSKTPAEAPYDSCYYQCRLTVRCSDGFAPLPNRNPAQSFSSRDQAVNALLYRNVRSYAVGHGCAADWGAGDLVTWVSTDIMPVAETKPTSAMPKELEGTSFYMRDLMRDETKAGSIEHFDALCDAYEGWTRRQKAIADGLEAEFRDTACDNLSDCEECLSRMRGGIATLRSSGIAWKAFRLMNEAMLMQHLHYDHISRHTESIEDAETCTWGWRPFQIAFILMNINSIVETGSEEHGKLDLIWFPTGGGKTEAYLGLSALTIIFERLSKQENIGSTVIMRYTLRLLTAQQFQRAAALICALELMRRKDPEALGEKEISIGMWVGSKASPNKWKDATSALREIEHTGRNALPLTRCPWCGEKLVEGRKHPGFKIARGREGNTVVKYLCPNKSCDFSGGLPVQIVDEGIYENPPTMVIGTVDKFAIIPFKRESYRLFGIDAEGRHIGAPSLIIQDELHLISGPLGSAVASFETLVSDLCSTESDGKVTRPKIVASTATISRAKEQCQELFALGSSDVVQFPASAVNYDDSFFSRIDHDAPGRRYVGVFAPKLSFVSASVRLYTDLLWAPTAWPEEDRDPYWTIVGYYSTIRELGQAATLESGDIPERLKERYRESGSGQRGRFLNNTVELTSRIDANAISEELARLETHYASGNFHKAVDICLATNMISVGLDIGRLSLMVVSGQPKTTSEYIQATSRVGRSSSNRGEIFVLYGAQRPRDRSHYEDFRHFHETLYSGVEPTSITAFSPQVRDRSLRSVAVGLYRRSATGADDYLQIDEEAFRKASDTIIARVKSVEPAEAEATSRELEEIHDEWEGQTPECWGEASGLNNGLTPLMFPRGQEPNNGVFTIPTSMRDVEPECLIHIISSY